MLQHNILLLQSMIKAFITYLNKPIAFVEHKTTRFFMSLFFGLFVFIFLYVFQPYGISKYPDTVFTKCMGYGFVTFIIMIFNSFLLPITLPRYFNANTFKVKNNIMISFWYLVTIAIVNWLYTDYFYGNESQDGFWAFMGITLSVGVFPMLIASYYMEKTLNNANQKTAHEATDQLQSIHGVRVKSTYMFQSENKQEQLEIENTKLICIKADGNYCEFYHQKSNDLRKDLLRITLKTVEEIVENEHDIVRSHRSYLVNLRRVVSVSGTARNLSLHFEHKEVIAPVSRSNEAFVMKAIRQMD